MSTNTTYAGRKRRKPIQKSAKAPVEGAKSNPSKRHRDRLNGELERMANLLPLPQDVISRLDKLTILRLSVSYLRAKSFFNVTLKSNSGPKPDGNGLKQLGGEDFLEGELLLQVLSGFVLVVTADGLVFFVSSTIQDYLGFHQTDVIHQSVYDLIHTEDRAEFQRQLHWSLNPNPSPEMGQESPDGKTAALPVTYYRPEQLPPENSTFLERNFVCRLRCLLDNSSGFMAMTFQGRLKFLHGQNQKSKDGQPIPPQLALFALATPLQPPSILEIRTKNFIFRTKHKMDFTPTACDAKGKIVLGYTEAELSSRGSGYQFIHAADMLYCAENHIRMIKTGESGVTVFRLLTKQSRWVWVQANARLVYKNGRPDCIIASQRVITEEEGEEHVRKRNLRLPFCFTTGEAVLYDTSVISGDDVDPSKRARTVHPDSLLGSLMKQDESIYVCLPAQNQNSFQHGALADSGDDLDRILSGDWQDDVLSLSENGIFKPDADSDVSMEDKSGDLLCFMKSLGICREDLELIQKDEEFLSVSLDNQDSLMDVEDEILSYLHESINRASDCIFANAADRKPDSGCATPLQQHGTLLCLRQGQPLSLAQPAQPMTLLHQQTQTHPHQPITEQHLHTQIHPHQQNQQQYPYQSVSLQKQQLLNLQQQCQPTVAQPMISHAQQPLPLQQLPQQPGYPPLQSPFPEQQRQLCHKMRQMQVNGKCQPVTQPPTTNGHPLPALFHAEQSFPEYGHLFLEGSGVEMPYRNQLNTLSITCNQEFSPYKIPEGLGTGDQSTPQDLEELLESLQPGALGQEQGGNSAPLCHPRALPMHQLLPETPGLARGQQLNPKLFALSTLGNQPYLANFQNGDNGDMIQTHPESSNGIDLPQAAIPLHQHPAEGRPFQNLTTGGFV
ncbi:hypothetical protein AGOR_G00211340 [Albula goreensis]|uniref:Aryl hydrocarbon receptor n=1 Tax=Albula goreensis TaxID=1534307 RepID=A0A8T3CQW0_9TELE|nr:hypothetical protein AGOR_G00211340 [Albula goreensis]